MWVPQWPSTHHVTQSPMWPDVSIKFMINCTHPGAGEEYAFATDLRRVCATPYRAATLLGSATYVGNR
jgi:hypothetical protein